MSIIVANDGSRMVNTIADRDAISKRFENMQVTVRDATADPKFGGGSVMYLWDAVSSLWVPVWSSLKSELVFSTEEKVIADGKVEADFVVKDNLVWSAKVLNTEGAILGDAAVTVSGSTIVVDDGASDGNTLRFTYAHGTMTTEMANIWDSKAGKLSPELEGKPTAPTAAVDSNDEQIATTEFVQRAVQNASSGLDEEAVNTLIGDALTDAELAGVPTAATAAVGTATEQLANTKFVDDTLRDAGFEHEAEGWKAPKPVLDQYTLKAVATTDTLDLAAQQVFTVNASTNRTLVFANEPGAGRAMTAVVKVLGKAGTINWPAGISWNGGTAPTLGDTFTVVVLFWDGSSWVGSVGSTA